MTELEQYYEAIDRNAQANKKFGESLEPDTLRKLTEAFDENTESLTYSTMLLQTLTVQ